VFGAVGNFPLKVVNDSSVYKYYQNIYKAEKCIMKNNFDSALIYYSNAEALNYMFMRDLGNSNICLSQSSNNEIKFNFLINRFTHRDNTTSEGVITWASSFLSEMWMVKLRDSINNIQRVNSGDEINYLELIKTLEEMEDADQKYRGAFLLSKKQRREMKNTDVKNFRKLKKLYSKYGSFSTGRLFGGGFMAYKMILFHSFHDKKMYRKHNDFFIGEVMEGRLNASDYAEIVDHYRCDSTQVYGCQTMFFVGDPLVVFHLSNEGKKRINRNRKQIFLQDIETEQDMQIWQWKKNNKFNFAMLWERVTYDPKQTASIIADQVLKDMGSLANSFSIITR
jgi:hypothetical protein